MIIEDVKRQCEIRMHEEVKSKFNENLAADFIFGSQIPKNKIVIMPNAIELDKFAYNQEIREQYRKQYGLENCFVIGYAGRFDYQKNHEFLIDVFASISKIIASAKLVLLGEGQLLPEIKKKVNRLGLDGKVHFFGYRADMNNWYQVMDVFCFPSRFEGLGIVLVEAQAVGLPCVISEAIPQEVRVTLDMFALPFNINQWTQQIMNCINHVDRMGSYAKLKSAGYDIQQQIKIIERGYMNEMV